MDSVIGRIQTEPDENGKRTDIHLATGINAIKMENGENLTEVIEKLGIGISVGKEIPNHSALLFIPD